MGCLTHTRCPARGALLTRNFPGLIPSLMASRFLWNLCKIPQKLSFFVIFWLATTFVACASQPQIEVLFHDFWRFSSI